MAIANPENYLTQASADARYQALGSLGSATPTQVDAGDTGTAGVSSSAARQDHEHPVAITSAQLVPAAWLAAWTSWSPTLTNMTQGNGTITAKFVQLGKTVHWRFKFVLGSTSAMGTGPTFSLPVALHADYAASAQEILGNGVARDAGVAGYNCQVYVASSTTAVISRIGGSGSADVNITAAAPFVWGSGDVLTAAGTYEAA